MNPYLEHPSVWEDFHTRFLVYAAGTLTKQTAPSYLVRIGEHIFVDEAEDDKEFHSDLSTVDSGRKAPTISNRAPAIAPPQTVRLAVRARKRRHRFLEVLDRAGRRVVTVIELLSPSNKRPGKDRDQFTLKREALLLSEVNYVEIDLLRGGMRWEKPRKAPTDYFIVVSRPAARPVADCWALSLRDRLPVIPIPLVPERPEPTLDVQAVVNVVYDDADYQFSIYDTPPEPALSPADAAWAAGLVAPPTGPG
jgi:hypothetical protein